jgi:hypothetical protein
MMNLKGLRLGDTVWEWSISDMVVMSYIYCYPDRPRSWRNLKAYQYIRAKTPHAKCGERAWRPATALRSQFGRSGVFGSRTWRGCRTLLSNPSFPAPSSKFPPSSTKLFYSSSHFPSFGLSLVLFPINRPTRSRAHWLTGSRVLGGAERPCDS